MKIGDVVDGWEIVSEMRKAGHSGEVWLVRRVDDPRRVAVMKRYTAGCACSAEDFRREDALVESQPIPGYMPRHLGRGVADGTPYFLMAKAEKLPETLPHKELVAVIKRIAAACEALRNCDPGYFHCDIKPDNIGLIGGKAVLLDFGCVMRVDEALRQNRAAGTPMFRAPEVLLGRITELSDIYSLAATAKKLSEKKSHFRLALATLPALSANPKKRPPSFAAFSALLDESEKSFFHLVRAYARLWRTAIITGGVVLLSVSAIASTLTIMANRKKPFTEQVLATHKELISALAEKRLGKYYLSVSNRTEAVRHFQNAADLGDTQAQRILGLLKEIDDRKATASR